MTIMEIKIEYEKIIKATKRYVENLEKELLRILKQYLNEAGIIIDENNYYYGSENIPLEKEAYQLGEETLEQWDNWADSMDEIISGGLKIIHNLFYDIDPRLQSLGMIEKDNSLFFSFTISNADIDISFKQAH